MAASLARHLVEAGHESAGFTIVASGPNGASPHGIFSIEPGIYLEGRFGVRIEDIVDGDGRRSQATEPS